MKDDIMSISPQSSVKLPEISGDQRPNIVLPVEVTNTFPIKNLLCRAFSLVPCRDMLEVTGTPVQDDTKDVFHASTHVTDVFNVSHTKTSHTQTDDAVGGIHSLQSHILYICMHTPQMNFSHKITLLHQGKRIGDHHERVLSTMYKSCILIISHNVKP